ncbi:SDR family oxidoreductase [Kribbella antibiotica]|uniref:SDR family oxidoreductase n=1 Tax=Kribbella antibiotica TaxID=190195 RepID=A0A4R4ZWJ7_9ACTN|nr:SDR family oxidoreductase [Kribbella antibiotica]TDD62736.1 SDR family oxidoreductase [Kribbella antibiotica]
MRIFITGASGWIGSVAVDELLADGHQVAGLARSDTSAAALAAKGVDVLRGDLDDLGIIRSGAAAADAVIHLANKHDFGPASNSAERAAVQTIGDELTGSNRPFLIASGINAVPGRVSTEADLSPLHGPDAPRGGAENLALSFQDKGVHPIAVRFAPTVHGAGDHGLIPMLVTHARTAGFVPYIGDGSNRWPAVHRTDASRLVALAITKAPAGAILHATAEEGIPTRNIAEAIARGLDLPASSVTPDEAITTLGWLGGFFAMDLPTSSTATKELLGWTPTGPTLLEDLATASYFHD